MRLARHVIPARLFAELAEGGGGTTAARHLAAADLSRRMLLMRGVVALARQSGHAHTAVVEEAYDLLADVQKRSPVAVDALLRHPAVGMWARRAVLALRGGRADDRGAPAGLARIAGAAAIRAGFACDIPVPAAHGRVMFPSLGQAVVPASSGRSADTGIASWPRLRCGPGGAVLLAGLHRVPIPGDPHREAAGWRGLRRLAAQALGLTIRLLIDDLDPDRMPVPTLRAWLAADEVRAWDAGLAGAWELLAEHHRTVAEEVATMIRVFTPLSVPAGGGQVSATSKEAFGCIGLSSAADSLRLAVTLAHEVQHAKLYQIMEIEPLTLADDGARYYAPWRTDPRPADALLQGAYAHLGVAGFWRRQRQVATGEGAMLAETHFARWRTATAQVTRTLLGSGHLTPAGQTFAGRMASVVEAWCGEPVPARARDQARAQAEQHARLWRREN